MVSQKSESKGNRKNWPVNRRSFDERAQCEKVAKEVPGDLKVSFQPDPGPLKPPIKGDTRAMGKDVAEFNFVGGGAEGFIGSPTWGVGRKETVFDADPHVFVNHETHPPKGLIGKDDI